MKKIVGGGPKKMLYALSTAKKIGLANSAKALGAKNTCKGCALGMGGQLGGMTDERGDFPSVCNKSVQAQSTDIQPPIASDIFNHSIAELRALSGYELEHLGRLNTPLFKPKEGDRFYEADWDWALDYTAERLKETPAARSFFYTSGRSSNEAGFLLQLLARLYGTNNVNNCSYYCHQASSVGLGTTIGTGTSTIELEDLTQCDLIFVIGANPASNHPRFIHKLKACRERGGQVIVINPAKEPGLVKFAVPKSARSLIAGGTDIASLYLQPNIGGDIALFKGIAKAIIEGGHEDRDFIAGHCDDFSRFADDIAQTPWELIEERCGIPKTTILEAAQCYARSTHAVFAWGMGMTHHEFGSENVEYIANLALLRGMVGKRHSGLLPLRGHSNVQGIGTIGVKPLLPEEVFQRIESHFNIRLPREPGMDTFSALSAAYAGNIDCACIVGGNLYSATPDSEWTANALNRVGFKCFLTTTLNQGHLHGNDDGEVLIFPVVARDEEEQPTTQESMFNYVRLSDGGIRRLDNARPESAILAAIGSKLLPDSPVDFTALAEHDSLREAIAATIPGMEALKDISVAKREFHIRNRLLHKPQFKTANGKAQFATRPLPLFDNKTDYPFLLASVRSEGQFNSIIYEETDSYRYNAGRRAVLIGQADMKALGLHNGDTVDIISAHGCMESAIVQEFDLPSGNLLAYYPEANVLSEHRIDPRSKTPNFKSIRVRLVANNHHHSAQ